MTSQIPSQMTSQQHPDDVNIGYFNNKAVRIPQTISQMIQNNSYPCKTIGSVVPNNVNSSRQSKNTAINGIAHKRPIIENTQTSRPYDTSFTDSNQSLDSGPEDDSSSTSGSYVIDLCDIENEIYVPPPVTV